MEIRITSRRGLCFLPHQARLPLQRLPMPFNQFRLSTIRNQTECVHSKPIHMAVRADDAVPCHCPEESMQATGLLAEEIPCGIMRRGSLGYLAVWTGFDGVDEVGEENCVLNEEDGDVVANNV